MGYNQMDSQYESKLGFSQDMNVCVGLHIAYLETTQVPYAFLNLSTALYPCLNMSLWDQGHKFNTSREPAGIRLVQTCGAEPLIIFQDLFNFFWHKGD